MLLDLAKEKVNSWKYRLITTRKRAVDICNITGLYSSKVSVLLNTPMDRVGNMRLCDFSAIEGAILEFEKKHYERLNQ